MVRALMNKNFGNIENSESPWADPTTDYYKNSKAGKEMIEAQAYPKAPIKNPKTDADRESNVKYYGLKALEDAAQNMLNERVYQHTNMYHPGSH